MSKLKYIVFELKGVVEFPILFPSVIEYSTIKDSIISSLGEECVVVSAGVTILRDMIDFPKRGKIVTLDCYNEDNDLNLSSREEDKFILESTLNRMANY